MSNLAILRRFWHYMKPYKGQFIAAMIATILMCISSVFEPIVIGLAITELSQNVLDMINGVPGAGVNFAYIRYVCMLYFVRGLFYHGGEFLGQYWLTNVVQSAIYDLRNDISQKINRLPVSYFDQQQTGDILARMTNDVDAMSNALQQSFLQVVIAVLSITFAVISMLVLNTRLALIVVIFIPITFFTARWLLRKSQPTFEKQANALGNLFGFTQEQLSGFTEIKVYGKENDSIEQFKERNLALREYGFRASFLSSLLTPVLGFITHLDYIVVATAGGFSVLAGTLTVGNLQAFIQYVWQINQPIQMITQLSGVMQSALAASHRVFILLDEAEEFQLPVTEHMPKKVQGRVEFQNVRFGYSKEQPLMENISFTVQPGEMVAVVGPTGAGKTTLINLLMRFYDIDQGKILIDDVDIQRVSRHDLRKHFGMVLQDAWLYTDTVQENIRLGDLEATDYEVQEAAEVANVDHFIRTLPGGYDMEINEEGNNVSLGQKQLMTIARAVLSKPDILILDEATSSVDTRLEQLIQGAMDKVMQGRTSFVIAHRLSTIRNADLILVMQNGTIIEHGNHDELLKHGGFYADLYQSQFNEDKPADIHMSY